MNPSSDESSADTKPGPGTSKGSGAAFVTTQWSMVQRAGRNDTPGAHAALEQLCRVYWHPLYHYVRRCGHRAEEARDLTQGFFARLLQRRALAKAEPERGRFRSFLLVSMKHFLADEWDKARALKRGGEEPRVIEFDAAVEEQRFSSELSKSENPEQGYDRRWALALLEEVYRRLQAEFAAQGKASHFTALRPALTGERGAVPHRAIAGRLGVSEGAVKVAVHRLRRRYRTLLKETIADTVADPADAEEELRHLLRILSG